MVLVLISASVVRFSVSHMRDFLVTAMYNTNKTRGPYLGRVTFILKLCVLVGLGFGWSWLLFVLVCLG